METMRVAKAIVADIVAVDAVVVAAEVVIMGLAAATIRTDTNSESQDFLKNSRGEIPGSFFVFVWHHGLKSVATIILSRASTGRKSPTEHP